MSAAPIYVSLDAVYRLMDVEADDDSLGNLSPIYGINKAEDLTFKEAVERAQVRGVGKRNNMCDAIARIKLLSHGFSTMPTLLFFTN